MLPASPPYLSMLAPGQSARVASLRPGGAISRRLQDLGLIEGTIVECLYKSPLGDPSAYLIRGAVIALRRSDAEGVSVVPICDTCPAAPEAVKKAVPHGAV